jgi:hypothetical protein
MGDWNEEFARGRREQGWSNQPGAEAYNRGSAQASRDQQNAFVEEQRRAHEQMQRQQAAYAASASGTPAPWTATDLSPAPPSYSGAASGGISSLTSAAKSGAGLLLLLFGLYVVLGQNAWTPAQILGGAGITLLVGAVAGAAVYIAVKLLVLALQVAGVLLVIGIGLHLLGTIDLFRILNRIAASL